MRATIFLRSIAAAAALTCIAGNASAEVCGANGNPVVYIAGTVKPYVTAIARALYNDTTDKGGPITIVYKGITSCIGIDAVLNGTPISGTAFYYDPGNPVPNNEVTCDLSATDGGTQFADIGASDVFAPTCGYATTTGLPPTIRDAFGPVQTMGFVVPSASSQHVISANAAYYIYGLGADVANVAPWTDPSLVYKRNETSGNSLLIGASLGFSPVKWKNTDALYSGNMISLLTSSSNPEKTLGVLAKTDITDTLSLSLRMLAYKDFSQSCGYYPDSTETAKDKQNVRDGHYKLWGPTHFYVKTDANGNIANPNVARVIGYLTGTLTAPNGLDLVQVDEVNNLVPECAMKVQRTSDNSQIAPFSPSNACGCYFDKLATGKTSCTSCTSSSQCPTSAPTCSFGFCETQ